MLELKTNFRNGLGISRSYQISIFSFLKNKLSPLLVLRGRKDYLLRMLAGLETIDSGQIIYNGENLPLDALKNEIFFGFVFQDFQLFPHLSVMENLILSPVKTMNVTKEGEQKAMSLLSV